MPTGPCSHVWDIYLFLITAQASAMTLIQRKISLNLIDSSIIVNHEEAMVIRTERNLDCHPGIWNHFPISTGCQALSNCFHDTVMTHNAGLMMAHVPGSLSIETRSQQWADRAL